MRFFWTGDYPALESAFVNEVKSTRGREPFLPLLILVSSRLLGLHLRRVLADEGIAHFNLRFWTIEDLAREVTASKFLEIGKIPVPPYADQFIVAHIAESLAKTDSEFYFKEIAAHAGFHRAILATIRDLKDARINLQDIHALLAEKRLSEFDHPSKLMNILQIWEAYEEKLAELGWYDDSDLIAEAAKRIGDSTVLDQTPEILVYGFYDLNNLQKRLLHQCFQRKSCLVFLPFEPTPAFDFVKPTLNWLKDNGFEGANAEFPSVQAREGTLQHLCTELFNSGKKVEGPIDALEIISAPGEIREISEVIRQVLQGMRKENLSPHEIGVLLRGPDPYFRLFHESLEGLGLKPYLSRGLSLGETRAGRSLLLLLGAIEENFSRRSVMELATFARLRLDRFAIKGERIPSPSNWDAISIQAGIVGGVNEWEEKLHRLKEGWQQKELPAKEEEARKPSKEELDSLTQLMRFIQALFKSLAIFQSASTWSAKVESLRTAFESLVEQDGDALKLRDALRKLSVLDETSIAPTEVNFSRVLEELLRNERFPHGRFQRHGPAVLNLMESRGLPFKWVIIPGLAEKLFPPEMNQDAILLDHERELLNQALGKNAEESLPLKARNRLEEERLLFRLAVGAARKKLILSFPRIEAGTEKERLPSSFLLAAVKALSGESIDFAKLEQFPCFRRIPLSETAGKDPQASLDEIDFDLSTAGEKIREERPEAILYLKAISPHFSRGLRLEASRWGKKIFTEFEGVLSSEEARKAIGNKFSIFHKGGSPTRLETYAACPYRYFLKFIMKIESISEPERLGAISPMDKGYLIHTILFRFYESLKKKRGVPLTLTPEDANVLETIAWDQFKEFEKRGVTGYSILWNVEKKTILDDLFRLFHGDLKDSEFMPAYFEVRYGIGAQHDGGSEISTCEPIPFNLGDRIINLSGRIDRIDLSRDGKKARVIDYKSGNSSAKSADFKGGRALQLPLYLYATERLLERRHRDLKIEKAQYLYLKDMKTASFSYAELEDRKNDLRQILQTIGEGIEQGLFIAVPDDHCKYCDYRLACGRWSQRLFDDKKEDPRTRVFLRMRDGKPATSGEDSIEVEDGG